MKDLVRIDNEMQWYLAVSAFVLPGQIRDEEDLDLERFKSIGSGWQYRWKNGESITNRMYLDHVIPPPPSYPCLVHFYHFDNRDDIGWGQQPKATFFNVI